MENSKEMIVQTEEKTVVEAASTEESSETAEKKDARSRKKGKWVKRVFGIIGLALLLLIVCAAIVLYRPVTTVTTVEQVDDGIYRITYNNDYKLDKALSANITTEDDFVKFISDTFFFGIPVKANDDYVACSAFLTQDEDDQYLTGRNFDYSETDLLAVYTHPSDGYASIGMAPLASLNVGIKDGIDAMSPLGKALMLAAPYMCVDGINEKGLMIGVLDLAPPRTRQDTGKPKINTMVAVRMLLDRAATVEEAVSMLEQYDFNAMSLYSQHLFIADAQGHSVVVEWQLNNTFGEPVGFAMKVVESPVCTNFWLCDGDPAGKCRRFDTLTSLLAEKPVNSSEDVMAKLEAASVKNTQWSCAYSLSDFSVTVSVDNHYDKKFSFSPDSFKK